MLPFEIKPLKISETQGIYPITLEQAVQDESGITLDIKLSAITAIINELHDNVVRTDVQDLTEEQKQQARINIGVVGTEDVVRTTEQELTVEQQQQARVNLGFGDGTIDVEATEGSQNLLTSDAVYKTYSNIQSIPNETIDEIVSEYTDSVSVSVDE